MYVYTDFNCSCFFVLFVCHIKTVINVWSVPEEFNFGSVIPYGNRMGGLVVMVDAFSRLNFHFCAGNVSFRNEGRIFDNCCFVYIP